MPLIRALPAMPSPTPAPMAPPPRASPPPIRPPAVAIALLRLDTATVTPWSLASLPKPWSVLFLQGHAEVQDGQEREDEGLDRQDQQAVEQLLPDIADAEQDEPLHRQQR